MFELSKTSQFKKDLKLIVKRNYDLSKLETVLGLLLNGEPLPSRFKEHPLKHNYKNHLDCHIEPDWVLIFKRNAEE